MTQHTDFHGFLETFPSDLYKFFGRFANLADEQGFI